MYITIPTPSINTNTPSSLRYAHVLQPAVVKWTQRLSRTGDQQWCTVRCELLSSNLVHCAAVSPNQSWQLQSRFFQGRKIKAWHWRCRVEIEEGVKNKSCFVEKFSRKKKKKLQTRSFSCGAHSNQDCIYVIAPPNRIQNIS